MMPHNLKRYCLISIGWLCIILASIGVVLPLLPTTPFLILALACFSKSSPRFHRMLLNHKWFGPHLAQWEHSHTIHQPIKRKAMLLIIITFAISIAVLAGRMELQLMLAVLCLILLWFVSRLKESEPPL